MKKNVIAFLLILCFHSNSVVSQISVPYYNDFDNPGDTTGWYHYALSGNDDWELGSPSKTFYSGAYSGINSWVTNLINPYSQNSERVLVTPSFDLSDTSKHYVLSFYQCRRSNYPVTYYYLDYTLNNGVTWQLLDTIALKENWQSTVGFFPYSLNAYQFSQMDIRYIQGHNNVRFRFRFSTTLGSGDGWIMDNFSIQESNTNIYATPTEPSHTSKYCTTFKLKNTIGFSSQFPGSIPNKTYYYFSTDSIFDTLDPLIAIDGQLMSSSITVNVNLTAPANLNVGNYFIFFKHDALDSLRENNENDNVGHCILYVDSIFNTPIMENFESVNESWRPYAYDPSQSVVWEFGEGTRHHLEKTHSGTYAWHTGKTLGFDITNCFFGCDHYIESPYFNLTTATGNIVLSLWYKNQIDTSVNSNSIEYSTDCGYSWAQLYQFNNCRNDDWDFVKINLNSFSSSRSIKFRVRFSLDYSSSEGMIFDDVYIGRNKPDLSIERDKLNRFTSTTFLNDTLPYFLVNSGSSTIQPTSTAFYWSSDSILDGSDILLGTKSEAILNDTVSIWDSFIYTKPTLSEGTYYIFYELDQTNLIDEMREDNNVHFFTLHQQNAYNIPYYNDFESQVDGWRHNETLGKDDWQWKTPDGIELNEAFSGTKAWITRDTGIISSMSRMHLYSPVFNLSTSLNPVMEFDMKLSSDGSCECFNSKTNMSYSIDDGSTWLILDTMSQSYNMWYYPMVYNSGIDYNSVITTKLLFEPLEKSFASFMEYNSRDVDRNTRFTLDIRFLSGVKQVQFRFNTATITNSTQTEGALVDNFSITEANIDLSILKKKALMLSSISQRIKFFLQIKNQGNYISNSCVNNYYVSTDSILDASDFLIGQDTIPSIRPDMYSYVNLAFNSPPNLSSYKYLIYKLDVSNLNIESNEFNNIGHLDLALDSINSYPYFNDFNDSIIDGWHQYSLLQNGSYSNYRFRNMKAVSEVVYQTDLHSQEWFTEMMTGASPYFYLESPAFNFENIDSIFLSFDIMCTGQVNSSNVDGGNLQFSIDGGNTWQVLLAQYGQSYHWYSYTLSGMDNERGWSGNPAGYGISRLDSAAFDLSFLRWRKNVVFQFKYKSSFALFGNGTVQGMRIDNFRIDGTPAVIDYLAIDTISTNVSATLQQPDFNISYSISNVSQTDGRVTKTRFYWSVDSIFDSGDILIDTMTINAISAGTTFTTNKTINYPRPLSQSTYYLFYMADGDSNIVETNENNNYGIFEVSFPAYPNYSVASVQDSAFILTTQNSFNVDYKIENNGGNVGANSNTAFYWSSDSIFDLLDQLILISNEPSILIGDSLVSSVSITYPLPITQSEYFLFYYADYDDQILELNETDNIGAFKITFDTLTFAPSLLYSRSIDVFVAEGNCFINLKSNLQEKQCNLKILNSIGQLVFSNNVKLNLGVNSFALPSNLPIGIYLVSLSNDSGILGACKFIQR